MGERGRSRFTVLFGLDSGFTLIELLVVSSLLAVISLTTYSGLAGGVKIWQRVEASIEEVDLALGLKKFRKDVVAHLPNSEIGFMGLPQELSFPGLIAVKDAAGVVHQEVGRIRYAFAESENTICREEMSYADVARGLNADCQPVFSGVGDVAFEYYGKEGSSDDSGAEGLGGWYTMWAEEKSPIAVRLEITLKGTGGKGEIVKQYTATLP